MNTWQARNLVPAQRNEGKKYFIDATRKTYFLITCANFYKFFPLFNH